MRSLSVIFLAAVIVQSAFAAQTIITYAGGGPERKEGLATSVSLFHPNGIVLDAAGNLFIADSDNNRICKVDAATKQLTVIAGSGIPGFADGPGAQAQFSFPTDIAVDAAGNVYVSDTYNVRIRKIDPTGTVSSFVGNVNPDPSSGDAVTIEFKLDSPVGVTIDSAGNMYICDDFQSKIYKVALSGGVPVAVAGNGTAGFAGDGGAATQAQLNGARRVIVDAAGNLFIADASNQRVRKVDAATGNISTVAGTGEIGFAGDGAAATAAMLTLPTCLALDAAGNLYISDSNNFRIRVVDPSGTINTLAGTGFDGFGGDGDDPLKSTFVFVLALTADAAGNLFVADTFDNRIREIGAGLTSSYDTDADGFPDAIETVALTNPNDAASTPFSNQPLINFDGHGLQKAAVKLNFAKPGTDSIQFSGILPIPDGVSVPTQQVLVDFGGVVAAFTLGKSGKSVAKSNNTFSLGTKPKDGVSKYSCKFSKGNFRSQLGDENLMNETVKDSFLVIPATIYFGNKSFTHNAFVTYTAKAGKSGQAKTGKNAFVPGGGTGMSTIPPRRANK